MKFTIKRVQGSLLEAVDRLIRSGVNRVCNSADLEGFDNKIRRSVKINP